VRLIKILQENQIKTIAFTRMDTGRLGLIASTEEWRLNQLREQGIDFSSGFPDLLLLSFRVAKGEASLFKEGVLFANKEAKGPVLAAFLEQIDWKPKKILFLDDKLDYLQSVEEALQSKGIEFIGYHYTEVEKRSILLEEELGRLQYNHLVQYERWLNDKEALEQLFQLK
jgi:hypothetical protein